MIIKTRDFGEIPIDEREIITFEAPIFGFENYRKFAFLYQEDVSRHFVWLQSTEESELCFILVDPALVAEDYCPQLPESAEKLLGEGDYMCWSLVVIRDPFDESTVNLKSPIVVNPTLKRAAQLILEPDYPLKHPLAKKEES